MRLCKGIEGEMRMLNDEDGQDSVESIYVKENKAEETLRASENYLEAISNSIFAGVVVVDKKTYETMDTNLNILEAIGASKELVIRKVRHSFICPAEKGKCLTSDMPKRWHHLLWAFPKRKNFQFFKTKERALRWLKE
jgi:transcriptional regulator with PAS, ATPase and Fis domain